MRWALMRAGERPEPTATKAASLTPGLEALTIRQLLEQRFPEVQLRKRFKEIPYLDQVTLQQVLDDPFALHDFLAECRRHPQCGDTSIQRLRGVIECAAASLEVAQ